MNPEGPIFSDLAFLDPPETAVLGPNRDSPGRARWLQNKSLSRLKTDSGEIYKKPLMRIKVNVDI